MPLCVCVVKQNFSRRRHAKQHYIPPEDEQQQQHEQKYMYIDTTKLTHTRAYHNREFEKTCMLHFFCCNNKNLITTRKNRLEPNYYIKQIKTTKRAPFRKYYKSLGES
jgi:hypothetical protein